MHRTPALFLWFNMVQQGGLSTVEFPTKSSSSREDVAHLSADGTKKIKGRSPIFEADGTPRDPQSDQHFVVRPYWSWSSVTFWKPLCHSMPIYCPCIPCMGYHGISNYIYLHLDDCGSSNTWILDIHCASYGICIYIHLSHLFFSRWWDLDWGGTHIIHA